MLNDYIHTPVGWLRLCASETSLLSISFLDREPEKNAADSNPVLEQTKQQLSEYFDGRRTKFDLPLQPGGTSFQQKVWKELMQIPYGKTINYGELAGRLGDPKKMRAVGRANGQNPIPIIIPCHRVIGSNNRLVGYGGGIERKEWLLRHEGALLL